MCSITASSSDVLRRRTTSYDVVRCVNGPLLTYLLTYLLILIGLLILSLRPVMALYLEGLCGHSDTTDSHMI